MDKKERDHIDDLFRDRLYDWEADTNPADWEAIASRLPEKGRVVSFRKAVRYWGAAAAVFLLGVAGSMYFFQGKGTSGDQASLQALSGENHPAAEEPSDPVAVGESVLASVGSEKKLQTSRLLSEAVAWTVSEEDSALPSVSPVKPAEGDLLEGRKKALAVPSANLIAGTTMPRVSMPESPVKKQPRKWGFGMGGGSLTAGTDNALPVSVLKNDMVDDDELDKLNAASNNSLSTNLPRTNVRHKMPFSFGFSVSRYLNDRWSLQTGLTYSLLLSDWASSGVYRGETRQTLHFIGIPLSVSYKIAEWNRFQFYTSAGAMAETNVAGRVKTTLYSGSEKMGSVVSHDRMKEWYWSVNARAGVSYPVIRFVSAFAEVGANYYFDNGSKIETIHSDKPFNVNLSLGFRLGF